EDRHAVPSLGLHAETGKSAGRTRFAGTSTVRSGRSLTGRPVSDDCRRVGLSVAVAATYYDEHVPESSVEILGHSVGGITYRHYAPRAPLAFRAIMPLSQPTAFSALIHGHDGECPCCRRPFADAG